VGPISTISPLNSTHPMTFKSNFKDKPSRALKIGMVAFTTLGVLVAAVALGRSALPSLAIYSSPRSIEGAMYALGILQIATASGLGLAGLSIPYLTRCATFS
jgi:hypothetical protein